MPLSFVFNQSFDGDDVVVATDFGLSGINERVFFQNKADCVHHLVVIVVFRWRNIETIDHIPASRHPPSEHPGQPFGGKAGYGAVQNNNSVGNFNINAADRFICLTYYFRFAFGNGPYGRGCEQILGQQGCADVVPNLPIFHLHGRHKPDPVDNPSYAGNCGSYLQRPFLGYDMLDLAFKGKDSV